MSTHNETWIVRKLHTSKQLHERIYMQSSDTPQSPHASINPCIPSRTSSCTSVFTHTHTHTHKNKHPFNPSRGAIPRDHRVLPPRIILVRHAESEGNVDNLAYTYLPDPKVPLVRDELQLCMCVGLASLWLEDGCA